MSYQVLYRRYRSQTFGDLVGQGHVVRTLQNAIQQEKIGHAYLFTGPRGTGKTSTARLLAKALNCEKGPAIEPCNVCHACVSITDGASMDVVEMDAASESGVEDVRENIVQAKEYKPAYCRFKVFIIDEVHDLSAKAFDALLKTIEEPPPHAIFILATTEYAKVPPTIRARCQKFEFHRGSLHDLTYRLSTVAQLEGIDVDVAALAAIARMADGGYRDALNLLEQAMLTADGRITLAHVYEQLGLVSDELVDDILLALSEEDVPKLLGRLDDVHRSGRDPRALVEAMTIRLSDLTRSAFGVEIGADTNATLEAALHDLARRLGPERIVRYRAQMAETLRDIREVSLPRLWLEAQLVQMARGPAVAVPTPIAAPIGTSAPRVPEPRPSASSVPAAAPVDTRPRTAGPAPSGPDLEGEPGPEFERVASVWRRAIVKLMEPKAWQSRLALARVLHVGGNRIRIEFSKRVDRDWVMDSPPRQKHVVSTLQSVAPDFALIVEYGVSAARETPSLVEALHEAAVELPLEGDPLEQAAKKVFGEPYETP